MEEMHSQIPLESFMGRLDLRAVVFDYGMVLSGPPDPASHSGMIKAVGIEPERFDEYYWASRERFDSGEFDGTAYWRQVALDAGIALTQTQLDQLLVLDARMWMSLNEPVLAWARQVRAAGFKIAILSNIGDTQVNAMRKHFGWLAEFDHNTWSYELRTAKPHAPIYLHTLEKLGVEPHQALFIDDRAVNVRGAEAVGMHGIIFTTLQQLAHDLKQRGFDRALPMPMVAAAALL
jgi:putative hydrolase of the HAD superfamily